MNNKITNALLTCLLLLQYIIEDIVPLKVEDLVDEEGAICVPTAPWKPNAVVDGRLATGQNPQSSLEAAQRALDVLRSLGPVFSPAGNENKPWGT